MTDKRTTGTHPDFVPTILAGIVTVVSALVIAALRVPWEWFTDEYNVHPGFLAATEVALAVVVLVLGLRLVFRLTGKPASGFVLRSTLVPLATSGTVVLLLVLGILFAPDRPPPLPIEVYADRDWQDAGIAVEVGQLLTIEHVTGKWSPWPGGSFDGDGCTAASGCSPDPNQAENVCCMAHAGLLGRIGNGAPFAVGNKTMLYAPEPGTVYLRINDVSQHDNYGSISVRVTTHAPPPYS